MDGLTVGRIVHYVLTKDDVRLINRRRHQTEKFDQPKGVQVHVGNDVTENEHVAAIVTRVWGAEGIVNLKCFLDGSDVYWATSIGFNDAEKPARSWHWTDAA